MENESVSSEETYEDSVNEDEESDFDDEIDEEPDEHAGGEFPEDEETAELVEGGGTDDEDEEPEEQFQKLMVTPDYIQEEHPETLGVNHEEVASLSKITYNEHGIIDDPLHKSSPFLTKYELTRVLGARAAQIDNGAKPFVVVGEVVLDGYTIAKEELRLKKIPFIIRRPMPNGKFEIWKLKDLENLY